MIISIHFCFLMEQFVSRSLNTFWGSPFLGPHFLKKGPLKLQKGPIWPSLANFYNKPCLSSQLTRRTSLLNTPKSLEFPQRLFSPICTWRGKTYCDNLHGVLRLWRMHTCSVAWKMCFYFHNKGRTVVTKSRKNIKLEIFAISVKIVKSVALRWG